MSPVVTWSTKLPVRLAQRAAYARASATSARSEPVARHQRRPGELGVGAAVDGGTAARGAARVPGHDVEAAVQRLGHGPGEAQSLDPRRAGAAEVHEEGADALRGVLGGQPDDREGEGPPVRLAVVARHGHRRALEAVAAVLPRQRRPRGECVARAPRQGSGQDAHGGQPPQTGLPPPSLGSWRRPEPPSCLRTAGCPAPVRRSGRPGASSVEVGSRRRAGRPAPDAVWRGEQTTTRRSRATPTPSRRPGAAAFGAACRG